MKIEDNNKWEGYTLEELRVRRLVTLTRIEIEKTRMLQKFDHFKNPAGSGGTSLMSKVLGAFSYVDYGIFAYKLMRKTYSVVRWFRKK